MSKSIFELHYPKESLHLLDIAMIVIERCHLQVDKENWKIQYSFSLDIDFDLIWQTIAFNNLSISWDRYITLRDDSKKSLLYNKSKRLSIDNVSIPFTRTEYLRLLDERIRDSLSIIGLVYISSLLWGNSITVYFRVWANILEDYKTDLIEKIRKSMSFKIYWDIQEIESTMIAKIRGIALDTKTTNLYLDTADFWRLFDEVEHPIFPIRKEDSIAICDIYYPEEPLELMLYILLIKWYLLSVKEYRWKFNVVMNPDILEQDEPMIKPIKFYEDTGDVYFNGNLVWKIKYKSVLYNFFLILYENQNIFIKTEDLAIKLNLLNHKRMPYEILNWYKFDLKDIGCLGESFVDTYIITENKEFKLKNI